MSKLMIRGGYGEHGRSCFLVEYDEKHSLYMVDCGIMDTDPSPYPQVSAEELGRITHLFLTHCHKDHSGAFQYFCEHGFHGTLVTTRMTCRLAKINYQNTVYFDDHGLDKAQSQENHVCRAEFGALTVHYGRSGHCPGGLWFEITDKSETILFSGDYQEDTLVYWCDPIRNVHAKLALIDCAHRETKLHAEELRNIIVDTVSRHQKEGRRVILPVPQYGRGLELLLMMRQKFPNLRVRVDGDFQMYAKAMLSEPIWYIPEAYEQLRQWENAGWDVMEIEDGLDHETYEYDIFLLADTHLKKPEHVDFVCQEIAAGAAVLINGRVKENGPVERILKEGKAERVLFPHHQSYGDLERLVSANQFEMVLPFHNHRKEVLLQ